MQIIEDIKNKARKNKKTIVLPESYDDRVLVAADKVIDQGIAEIVLIGHPDKIKESIARLGLKKLGGVQLVDPQKHEKKEIYTDLLYEIRKSKGLSREDASKLTENPLYLGCLMIKNGDADGEVCGSMSATSDVLKPALQIIKTRQGLSIASSYFLMVLKTPDFGDNGVLFYADCGFNINPDEHELAEIALSTAYTVRGYGIEPRVAMLSFSTKGSAKHEMADKVINATRIAREKDPSVKIDGELQADAALIESIGKQKSPGSEIAGRANVLIFPNLDAGNIAYKLTQRLAGAEAIGPIVQGLAKPVNDLSRGCSAEDIVTTVAITAIQANEK